MRPNSCIYRSYLVIYVVLVLMCGCDSFRIKVKPKVKRKVESVNYVKENRIIEAGEHKNYNVTDKENGRGFFHPGSLFNLGKVLNFFPVGGERECQPSKGNTIARSGICLNPYDCRQRDGKAGGDCAHGLGVCCVFEVTCGGVVQNNLTYFMSPRFPELWGGQEECNITIDKTHAGIMQLRIDFVHFSIGQPNIQTGDCDEDVMTIGDGGNMFRTCGQNHGQHIYYTLSTATESRADDDLPSSAQTRLSIKIGRSHLPRLWLLRLAQMPLAYSAPHDCLQYYTQTEGTISTFNYATNGRYLSNQKYRACIRRNTGMCAVKYTPCDDRSFRIGPTRELQNYAADAYSMGPGNFGGPGTGFYGPDGSFIGQNGPTGSTGPTVSNGPTDGPVGPPGATVPALDQLVSETENDPVVEDGMMPVNDQVANDEVANDEVNNDEVAEDMVEGSGADPGIEPAAVPAAAPSMGSRIWSFMFPSWLWGQTSGQARGQDSSHSRRKDSNHARWQDSSHDRGQTSGQARGQDSSHSRRKDSNHARWQDSSHDRGQTSRQAMGQDSSQARLQGQSRQPRVWGFWSPYAQHYSNKQDPVLYDGYGNFGVNLKGFGRQGCKDRITIPCDNEYFISNTTYVSGVCDPHHCGSSFCPGSSPTSPRCAVLSSVSPFAVSVHFGVPEKTDAKLRAEDYTGACLAYTQVACDDAA